MKSNFFNKFYKNIFLDKYDNEYINFNYNIFNKPKLNKKVLLSELDWRESDIIGSSFLIDRILRKYKAELACFSPNLTTGFFNWLKKIFFKFTNRKIYKINKSLGVNTFIFPTLSKKQKKTSSEIFLSIKKKIKNKRDVINFSFDKIYYGDLLYDFHLRKYNIPTIDFKSNLIFEDLEYFIKLVIYWKDFVKVNKNKMCGLLIGHCCYNHGILQRICLFNNIKTYEASTEYIFAHTKKNFHTFKDWDHSFLEINKFNKDKKKKLVKIGKKILKKRFEGKNDRNSSFMIWATKYQTYNKKKYKNIFEKNNKKRFVVFAHCFFDNPNVFGKNFFCDFYEWIDYIGKKSIIYKNIDWYIKKHPGGQPGNNKIFQYFKNKYPRLKILPTKSLNSDLIKEGFDYATTIYGNIGYELAYHNIPLIYGTSNNPTSNYNFNKQVKSFKEYDYYMSNPHKIRLRYDKKKIAEYFVSKFVMQDNNIFFSKKDNMIIDKNYSIDDNLMTNAGFKNFVASFNKEKHKQINFKIDKFLKKHNFRADKLYEEIIEKF